MIRTPVSIFLVLAASWPLIASIVRADDRSESPFVQPPELHTVFHDNFVRDTRADYEVCGDVAWLPGQALLSPGFSLERPINGGPWAKVTFEAESPALTPAQPQRELRVWFLLDDATNCFVSLQACLGAEGCTGRLSIADTGEQDGQPTALVVREAELKPEHLDLRQWTIEYRYGLVRVSAGDRELLLAHIENRLARVHATKVEVLASQFTLNTLEAAGTPDTTVPTGDLSDEQQQQLAAMEEKLRSHYDQGDLAATVKICQQELAFFESTFGKQHPQCAGPLMNLAMLYEELGDAHRAVECYQQAVEINKSALGPYHPSYLDCLNELMLTYASGGDYTRAEPLCEQVVQIRKSLQGEQHPDYAVSLSVLANMLEERGEYARAESLYREAHESLRAARGERHPDCATVLSNLALLYKNKGEFARAEPLFLQAIEIVRATLGEQHPGFAYKLNNLAELYTAMGAFDRAERMYRQALPIVREADGEESAEYATLLNNLALVLDQRGDYAQAESLFQRAMEIRKAVLGEDHPDYASSLGNLGGLYSEMGNLVRAEPLYEEAMKIRKDVLGERHPDYVNSLFALGLLHSAKGEYPKAKVLYERVLEMRKSLWGNRHPDVLLTMHNLAVLYRNMGDYPRAETLFKQVLEIEKTVLGEQHPDYAASLNQLAVLYERMDDFAQAERLYLQAMEINKAAFGDKHPAYAKCLNNLAMLYANMGKFARAEQFYQEAISSLRATAGTSHPDYPTFVNNLGHLYQLMGDCSRAEPLYRQSLEITKAALGEQSPGYAVQLNNLASLYDDMGDFDRAQELSNQAVTTLEAALGRQHPNYAVAVNNLASLYRDMGDYARAEQLFLQSLEIRRATLGEMHSEYAASVNNLAGLYAAKGDYARAEPLFRQVLEIYRNAFGDRNVKYAVGLNNLALLHYDMRDYARAEPWYREAMEIRKDVLGDRHPDYAASLGNLGLLYLRLGDFHRAVQYCQQATEIRKAIQGAEHIDCAKSMNNLAAVYDDMGQYDRAKPLYEASLAVWQKALGEEHPSTAACLNNMAQLYCDMSDYAHARTLCEKSMEIRKRVLGERHPDYANSVGNLAEWHRINGDYAQAVSLARTATTIVRQHLDLTSLVQSERQQKAMQAANRYFLDNYLSSAVAAQPDWCPVVETIWQWKGVVSLRQQVYRQLAARPELAPLFGQLQSVSHQLSTLSDRAPIPPRSADVATLQTTYEMKRKLWEDRFAELVREREDLEQQIASQSEPFKLAQESLTVANVQQVLSQDTALVDFLDYNRAENDPTRIRKTRSERQYLAIVIRRDRDPVVIPLGDVRTLEDSVITFRRPFAANVDSAATQRSATAAAQLRTELWIPIEQHLSGIKTVIISPDTALGTLPFAALPGKTEGSYLVEEYRIGTLPMARLLQNLYQQQRESPRQGGLLVLGDVDYNTSSGSSGSELPLPQPLAVNDERDDGRRTGEVAKNQWTSLPGFRDELGVVTSRHQQRFGTGAEVTTLTGTRATEASFLQAALRCSTLHLVTHGYFEDPGLKSIDQAAAHTAVADAEAQGPDPLINTWMPGLLSGLVMAGANSAGSSDDSSHDGILRAAEIEAASLQGVDLVTLSACETGLGAVAGGEGLTGLQRAFHIAGARTVLASLWKVDDRATLELITRFYTNLWQKNMSKLDALREAQLWMLHHPRELEALGIHDAGTRGRVADLPRTDPKTPLRTASDRTDPYYWAAFQLSGDWQ